MKACSLSGSIWLLASLTELILTRPPERCVDSRGWKTCVGLLPRGRHFYTETRAASTPGASEVEPRLPAHELCESIAAGSKSQRARRGNDVFDRGSKAATHLAKGGALHGVGHTRDDARGHEA